MDNFIPLSIPNFVGNERKYVDKAVEEGWVSTGGQAITDFENEICKYVKSNHAVAVQSGTAGLHLGLINVGVKQGDLVIVPTLTFIAAVNPVRYCGAEPVFMDCDDTLCMDMDKLEEFISNECKFNGENLIHIETQKVVRAVVAVHVFGNLCNMDKLMEIATKNNLKIVEDATEAIGGYYKQGKYKEVYAGLVGDVGAYSFNGNKIITTGGGGMIVTNNKNIADRSRYLSTQAKDDMVYFIHGDVGYNYRMTNLQGALGLAQLEKLSEFIKTKHQNYDRYIKNGIALHPFREDVYSNKWFYSYKTNNSKERDDLIQYMQASKIQTRPIWALIHTLNPYKDCISYKIEKAIYYQDRIVNIPCSTSLTFEDVDRVSRCIKEWENERGN